MFKQIKQKIYKFLIWSQKWTKTDMVYLAKGGFWLNLGQISIMIISLAVTIAFANLLSTETYGIFKLMISYISIISVVTLTGMNTALTKSVAKGYDKTIKSVVKTRIKWGFIGTIVSLIIASYYFINNNTILGTSFIIISAFFPFTESFNSWESFLNGRKDFKNLSTYRIIAVAIKVSILLCVVFITQNLFIILLTEILSTTIIRFIFLKITLKNYPIKGGEDPDAIKYGKHLSAINAITLVISRLDSVLIFHYLGAFELVIFELTIRFISQLNGPLGSLKKLIVPKISQRSIPELKKTIFKKMIQLFIIILPVIIFGFFIIPPFYSLFFPKYTETIPYAQVYLFTLLLSPLTFLTSSLTLHAPKKYIYTLRIAPSFIKIVSIIILLPLFKIWGMIISIFISQIFGGLIAFYLFNKISNQTKKI